ncbi:sulfate adenylyltransferase subunit 1 [Clostridium saccharoperbutylacetonicum]|uniref:sulfate adenylyltransferase subunit 1 n=1 Tax=Clostridium saccharoperbutylacetonicum TaxID=36745 RepID=UPI000983BF36|nr:GTP-binding protein [Clostridium saccharoperbutylacetonicum]AQR95397.1 sulfate adenylyltransferase subunit 1 [Clostridium saccharoperbutylacetonicum]NSB31254.1 sulfate adenylyltransferase subunit 1 [Clostridium saccharoperbutylacetonicum]
MKSLLKFITCGSVDDGKSTLIGHILYDSKLLYADQEKALELDSKVGSRGGAIDYSLLLDGLMAEREQGITIDVAYRYFTTDNRSFIVADTPGHEEYTRNMAVGASFAELSIILLDAKQGVLVQTRRHARICSLMGVKNFVFAVNKMDLVGYSEERFLEIEAQIKGLEEELSLENVYIIPVSATEGDNVTKKSKNTPWYDGDALLPYLENVDINTKSEEGFYMPVQRVCRPNHTFRGFQGEIEAGSISVGDEIITLPSNEKALVKSIHITNKDSQSAGKGQAVTIQLNKEVDVSRGCVLTKNSNIRTSKSFSTKILWMDDSELAAGKEYFVKVGTKMLTGVVTEVKYKIDVNTGEHLPTNVLTKNEIAACDILLSEKIVVDKFDAHKTLGELILIDRITNMTSACGVIEGINNNEIKNEKFTFGYKELKARGELFEEFYYEAETSSIFKYKAEEKIYTVGDELPIKGDSYEYPENFDILILRDWIAIEVRNKRITDIKSIDTYEYQEIPIINGRGFGVNAYSTEEVASFLEEYKNSNENSPGTFLKRWTKFEIYRRIAFHSTNREKTEQSRDYTI